MPNPSLRTIGRAMIVVAFLLFIPDVVVGIVLFRFIGEIGPSMIVTAFLFLFSFMLIGFGFAAINSDLSPKK